MIATLRALTETITVIGDPAEIAAAEKGELLAEDGRIVLVAKGGDTRAAVRIIYGLFAKKTDHTGHAFTMSHALHGLCHRDTWGAIARVSGSEFEAYLSKWTQFTERIANNDGAALKLLDHLPPFASAAFLQGRWLSPEIAASFTWVD